MNKGRIHEEIKEIFEISSRCSRCDFFQFFQPILDFKHSLDAKMSLKDKEFKRFSDCDV